MKFIKRSLFVAAAGLALLVSCAKEQTESYDTFEDQTLEAWIAQNRPELSANYQTFGSSGYYLEVLDAGRPQPAVDDAGKQNPQNMVIADTLCWVKFDFSGRDLSGKIILTRRAVEAKLIGTFTKYTHYVPYYRYCGEDNSGLMEGTFLAMRREQVVSQEYFDSHPEAFRDVASRQFYLSKDSHVRLYMPSRVVGGSGVEGDGGYEGQYSLSAGRPLIVEMKITDIVKNPLGAEGTEVDDFCKTAANGGLQIYTSEKTEMGIPLPEDSEDENHPYNIDKRWVSACDSVPQLYVNFRYKPDDKIVFPAPYNVGSWPYSDESAGALTPRSRMEELDRQIAEALKERFGKEAEYDHVAKLDADSVGMEGTAKIWYIGRFLNGFVFDTNIDEVKKIVYGEVKKTGEYLSYKPSEGDLIQAFYYVVPNLKFGQWASFVTASTNAYGARGVNGTTSTSSSSSSSGYTSGYSDYLNLLNYANSYYGNSYGGYYGNYFGGYGNGYYDPYYGYGYDYNYGYGDSSSDAAEETETRTSTEIPPFTPLLYQIFVEPAD